MEGLIQQINFGRRVFVRDIEYAVIHTLPNDCLMVVSPEEELPARVLFIYEKDLDPIIQKEQDATQSRKIPKDNK